VIALLARHLAKAFAD
jgi:hypothetical protein